MMRILLTNDDGIHAPGIIALCTELATIGNVCVVAPDSEKSATSQAITVHHPIRVDQYSFPVAGVQAWRIGGTPTDCVKIALESLMMEQPPDIVISGINLGPNLGTDVLYSGTVSAAIEGALHDLPAIAVSLDSWQMTDFTPAAQFTARLAITVLQENTLPAGTVLNVNVPAVTQSNLQGVRISRLGQRIYENTFDRRVDPRGRSYYWMGGNLKDLPHTEDTDVAAVQDNYISVTPIHIDLTHYKGMELLQNWKLE